MLTEKWEGDCYTHVGFPLRWLSSHEGVGHAVLWATFPVTGLVIAFKLARAPAVIQWAVATTLLAKLHVVIDHLIWICMKKRKTQDRHRKCNQKCYSLAKPFIQILGPTESADKYMQINNMLQSNRIVLKLIQCFNDLQISVFGKKKSERDSEDYRQELQYWILWNVGNKTKNSQTRVGVRVLSGHVIINHLIWIWSKWSH